MRYLSNFITVHHNYGLQCSTQYIILLNTIGLNLDRKSKLNTSCPFGFHWHYHFTPKSPYIISILFVKNDYLQAIVLVLCNSIFTEFALIIQYRPSDEIAARARESREERSITRCRHGAIVIIILRIRHVHYRNNVRRGGGGGPLKKSV